MNDDEDDAMMERFAAVMNAFLFESDNSYTS